MEEEAKPQPFTPRKAREAKLGLFPNFVIESFNEIIARKLWANKVSFSEEEILNLISSKSGCSHAEIKKNGWLNVEPIFRRKGWNIIFDISGYGIQPSFTFSKRKRSKKTKKDI